ncbi:hypothetical protein IJ076_00175 [Candidatus Saccharibacteria bacterium]|nr:hypothetical protein [Candidatus Saccharibacteria bacterium]
MAISLSIGKKATKLTKPQQLMILAVFGTAIFLGAAIAVVIYASNKISFSASVIVAQDQSIVSFSDTIKNIGICRKPSGQVYSDDELKKCSPNSITVSSVPNTLRSNIIQNVAANQALESVPNTSNASCVNPDTGKNYTYDELEANYTEAENDGDDKEIAAAVDLLESCSALRVIPDALPAYKNEEALLASVDKIFRDSGTEPESLSPTEETDWATFGNNLYTISVRLAIESNTGTVYKLLDNVERSIRNFNVERATITWSSNSSIDLEARATAYYMLPTTLNISTKSIKPGGK